MQDATRQLDDALRARVRASRSLPSPPVVAARLIELGEDPNVGLSALVEVLRTDPALSARLLRIANSPLYARRRSAENLHQAVVMLGMDAVFTAALSLTIMSDREALGSSQLSFHTRWTRSVHAAVASQLLAQRCPGLVPADAFLAALVQDIGILVMARLEPRVYEHLESDASHDDFRAAELEWFGADHAVVGAELLAAWQLPAHIVSAVQLSHEGGRVAVSEDRLASVIAVGAHLADWLSGEQDRIQSAAAAAEALLGVGEDEFRAVVDDIADALPDLAPLLNADVPSTEALAEMAADAMVARQLMHTNAVMQMREDLAGLTEVTRQLEAANRTDPLTGLANRRYLDQLLDKEFDLARRHGHDLSVLFVDLDDFKHVNDVHGHHSGDEVLRMTADLITSTLRDGDHVGRYGGDEMVVLLPATRMPQAEIVAGRLIRLLEDNPCPIDGDPDYHQRATIGIASTAQLPFGADVDALLKAADNALLIAKRDGKGSWNSGTAVSSGSPVPVSSRA